MASRSQRFDAATISGSRTGEPAWFTQRRICRSKGGATAAPYHRRPARRATSRAAVEPWRASGDTQGAGGADGADGEVRKAPARATRARVQAVSQRAGSAHLRQHLARGVEDVAGTLQDGHERVPP